MEESSENPQSGCTHQTPILILPLSKKFGKCQIEKSDRRTGRLKTEADSDDLPVFYPLFLEAVVNAQAYITSGTW